ncbi:hypothetical protein CVT25_008749 [Psilocybe cyanescens]|uniref:F-box domain-containing protein n=1 Tax=Psilocybe cyanescens TaxID=93625 RepID=A0A409XNM6_PSICY|nr:hypothetical protein CVT25_008749 [Psilocybe cyanescens]
MSVMLADIDVHAVHQAIFEHEREIGIIDHEIESLLQSVRRLQFQKDLHHAEIRKCKGKITLASRLPPEILAYIFELCVLDGRTRTPLVVSHVCSAWRIASTIPTVWSHVYINLDSRHPCQRTQLWLRNSRHTLLTIEIEIGAETSQLKSTMEVLMAEIWRWKTLIIKSSLLDPVNQVLQVCDTPASQLRTIEISVDQEFLLEPDGADDNGHELLGLRALSINAPLLRTLRIHRNLLPGRHTLPLSITELTLQLPNHHGPTIIHSMLSIIRLLEELSNLEVLVVEVPNGNNQTFSLNAQSGHTVELANLRSLTLMGDNNIFGLLPHLRTPFLTHLTLRSSLNYPQAQHTSGWIYEFLQESCPPITLLELRDLAVDPILYSQMFDRLPLLEDLRLHDSDILDDMLLQLQGPHGLCPMLKRLDLRWCGRLSGRALVNLVRSRLSSCVDGDESVLLASKSIMEVALINCSFVKEEDIVDLAEMTICRLIHRGQTDFCYAYACCDNERYRRRLKQRSLFHPALRQNYAASRLVF